MPKPRSAASDVSNAAEAARAERVREFALVAVVIVLGFLLRALQPGAMAIEHFDEGVYASNLYCGHLDPPFAYPMRHLYAPPLFPAFLEWVQILAGPSAVMWVNVVLGGLSVVAVWWATRCWFGATAAVAAAVLAATSEYHVAFSRMALTDVPLSLFMLLGVFAGWKGILTGRPLWITAAGLFAGLAWCTKYNGWLTLAVTGSGTAAAYVVVGRLHGNPRDPKLETKVIANCKLQTANCKLRSAVVRWGVTVGIAGVIFWAFVLRELAPFGGYAAVARNHAGYFVGLGGWWTGFLRQAAAHGHLMGWPTCIGIAVAWLACNWLGRGRSQTGAISATTRILSVVSVVAAAIVVSVVARFLSASGVLAILAVCGFGAIQWQAVATSPEGRERQLAAWMLLAWFVGLLVAVPLYFPYPRLSLPWVVATWPLAGAAIAWLGQLVSRSWTSDRPLESTSPLPIGKPWLANSGLASAPPESPRAPIQRLWRSAAVMLVVGVPLMAFAASRQAQRPVLDFPAWQLRSLAAGIAEVLLIEIETAAARDGQTGASDIDAVVYVEGDPATFFQLAALCQSRPIVILPIADAAGLQPTGGVPTYLVTHETTGSAEPATPSLQLIQSHRYRASDLVLLDRMPASELQRSGNRPTDALRLFEVRPVE